ncbi:MAG TPA: DUF4350 domain-containing protein [Pyrinomonadaceae bacterium]|nr:DUF4350 domain-containing protein [Pyrinomonadaceae bacterium]
MRNRVTIVASIALVLLLLVVLNAASYVRLERQSDSEFTPDRSTYNAGATGTRALYEYLQESGQKVVRWRKSPLALLGDEPVQPSTFVVVGGLRREFGKEEAEGLLRWVARGGRLVVIDRSPNIALLPSAGDWRVASELSEMPGPDTRPDDVETMTAGVKPLAPAQPTLLTRDVQQVLRSRFASRLRIYPLDERAKNISGGGTGPTAPATNERAGNADEDGATDGEGETPPNLWPWATPTPVSITVEDEAKDESEASPAPVEHLRDGREGEGALLLDYAYGRGRVVVLSDPFIVANTGISRADNLQLAVNLIASGGVVAFDEFHQGHAATENMTLAYFKDTPILPMFAQCSVVLLAVLWTHSRRFARPLPAPRTDRRSNLEYVASMAELQQRARAYDLAIENVYGRTRRALARYGGTSNTASYREIAGRVAARSGRDAQSLEELLHECEDIIAGARVSSRRTLQLVASLREWERALGIRMRAREIRQAKAL